MPHYPLSLQIEVPEALLPYTDPSLGVSSVSKAIPLKDDKVLLLLSLGGETPVYHHWGLYQPSTSTITPLTSPTVPQDRIVSNVWPGIAPGTVIVQSDDVLWIFSVVGDKLEARKLVDLPANTNEVQVAADKVVCLVEKETYTADPIIWPFPKGARPPLTVSGWSVATGWFDVSEADKDAEELKISGNGNRAVWKVYTNQYAPEEGERGEYWGCEIDFTHPTTKSTAVQLTQGAGRVYSMEVTADGSGVLFAANYRDRLDNHCITTHLDLWFIDWPKTQSISPPVRITPGNTHIEFFGFAPTQQGAKFTVWFTVLDDVIFNSQMVSVGTDGKLQQPKPLEFAATGDITWVDDGSSGYYGHESESTLAHVVQISSNGDTITSTPVAQPDLVKFEGFELTIIRWKADDGKEVSGIMYENKSGRKDKTLLVHAHGGPAAPMPALKSNLMNCSRYPYRQLLAAGYRILQPMFRGGLGRGDDWAQGNNGQMGNPGAGGDLNDIITGIDYVISQFGGDKSRVGIFGGSYGGYMVMRGMGVTDRFAAGVALYGFISNRLQSLEGGDMTWENEYIGSHKVWPMTDETTKSDNLQHLYKISSPLLFMHGEKDDVCTPSQSVMGFRCLTETPTETGLVMYPNEKHGFKQENHREDRDKRILAWFLKYLQP